MGTWSITPNNGLASIDANSGVATFREHTSDVTYTIHFSDSTCTGGEVTKTFMVFACSQPTCVCSAFSATTSGTRVPSATSSTEYIVGRYTAATNCTDSISITPRTGTDFLTGLRVSGGNIYAKVAVANTGSERSSTYFVRQGGCEDYFTAFQSSGGTPPTPTACTCTTTPVTTSLPSGVTSNVTVGSYTRSGDCSGAYRAEFTGSGTDFLGSFTFSSNVIKANVTSANPTTSTRSGTYRIYRGDTLCSSNFRVTQAAGSPTPAACTCSSSNFSVTGVNVDASGGNAVLIANFTSECEPSLSFGNYAGETFINYSMTSSTYDSSTKKGKIYAKVPQNTASSDRMEQVGVYINGETDFCKHFAVTQSGATPSCNCNSVNITTTSVTFDASGGTKTIGSITSGCTLNPLSTFSWGKLYQDGTSIKVSADTNSSTTGRGTGITYNVIGSTLNSCGTITIGQKGQVPESWSINLRIANNDSEYHCINNVEIFLDTYGSIQTAQGECVNAGGEENLGTISFPNSASAPEGATITRIEAVVNDGGSGAGTIKTLTTNNSILRNGNNYLFTLPAS